MLPFTKYTQPFAVLKTSRRFRSSIIPRIWLCCYLVWTMECSLVGNGFEYVELKLSSRYDSEERDFNIRCFLDNVWIHIIKIKWRHDLLILVVESTVPKMAVFTLKRDQFPTVYAHMVRRRAIEYKANNQSVHMSCFEYIFKETIWQRVHYSISPLQN